MKKIALSKKQLCDFEMLATQAFSPLDGFMCQADYESVLNRMRLESGVVWPMPVTLDVSDDVADSLSVGEEVELVNPEGAILARMTIEDRWCPDKFDEAKKVFGTMDTAHPAVKYLFEHTHDNYIGGRLNVIVLPKHYDFSSLRKTPRELKALFKKQGWEKIVGFQTRNPMHRAHQELTLSASKEYDAHLLIHPVVGMTKPGDVDHCTRVHCYQKILETYPKDLACLSLLPLAMRMAGPREALWHAIIRKNYGCTHFIVGRDHAAPGLDSQGELFYDPYAAQELVEKYENEIGIQMVPFKEVVYVKNRKIYLPFDKVSRDDEVLKISGTEVRKRLLENIDIPEWFSYPEIIKILRKRYSKKQKGVCFFLTGLSGAGKSTLANALTHFFNQRGREVTLLDGDIVRKNLSSELNFSREHRDLNIHRIGFVASEIVKHGGVVVCAAIAPYQEARRDVRRMVSQQGDFFEIYVSTPLDVCEMRDPKGLYKKAREGVITQFTGINDPYEAPEEPEFDIDTSKASLDEAISLITRESQEAKVIF